MTAVRFCFVDVFARRPLSGNPLTLVPDADELPLETMQAIARELNQSETAFVVEPDLAGADWQIRSLTPIGAEVGGVGHNVLGACIWLALHRVSADADEFVVQVGTDLVTVHVTRAEDRVTVSIDQEAARFGDVLDDRSGLAAALGIRVDDLADADAVVISTGAGHLMVPVRSPQVVDGVRPEPDPLSDLLRSVGGEGCYVYCATPDSADGHAYARFFNPIMGIAEDPATGTAAGPLAARLVADGDLPDGTTVLVDQGAATGRPSRLEVTVTGSRVRLSGGGLVVADGTLHL